MKKVMLFAVISIALGSVMVRAANQNNWGTSTGGSWNTPDDTQATKNQFLQIGGNGGAQVVASSNPVVIGQTKAAILASSPTYVGTIAFCTDCVGSPICISTTAAVNSAWVVVGSTNSFANLVTCK